MVIVYDVTLREGAQTSEINFSVQDKLEITELLYKEIGIIYIEGGYPFSNKTDREYFSRVKDLNLPGVKIAAFGSTRRKDCEAEDDKQLRALLEADTPVITIVGKSCAKQVRYTLRTTDKENLAMIYDSIKYLKDNSEAEVIFDAEHFFDGYKENQEYSMKTLKFAEEAGADFIVLCDTRGGTDFDVIDYITRKVTGCFDSSKLGIHAHNDRGYAIVDTEIAVRNGFGMVQGTINGYGERCGGADLLINIANLDDKGYCHIPEDKLANFTSLSREIAQIAKMEPNLWQPYVGENAFGHKGGLHGASVLRLEESYEHVSPEKFGNKRRFLASGLSGRGTIEAIFSRLGVKKESGEAEKILDEIKDKANEGYNFDRADTSVELIALRILGYGVDVFKPEYEINTINRNGIDRTTATVWVETIDDEIEKTSEGDGPLNALDKALKAALSEQHPELNEVELKKYKVYNLPGDTGTSARVRVDIITEYRGETLNTVGVSGNQDKASIEALLDAYNFAHFMNHNKIIQ